VSSGAGALLSSLPPSIVVVLGLKKASTFFCHEGVGLTTTGLPPPPSFFFEGVEPKDDDDDDAVEGAALDAALDDLPPATTASARVRGIVTFSQLDFYRFYLERERDLFWAIVSQIDPRSTFEFELEQFKQVK